MIAVQQSARLHHERLDLCAHPRLLADLEVEYGTADILNAPPLFEPSTGPSQTYKLGLCIVAENCPPAVLGQNNLVSPVSIHIKCHDPSRNPHFLAFFRFSH